MDVAALNSTGRGEGVLDIVRICGGDTSEGQPTEERRGSGMQENETSAKLRNKMREKREAIAQYTACRAQGILGQINFTT